MKRKTWGYSHADGDGVANSSELPEPVCQGGCRVHVGGVKFGMRPLSLWAGWSEGRVASRAGREALRFCYEDCCREAADRRFPDELLARRSDRRSNDSQVRCVLRSVGRAARDGTTEFISAEARTPDTRTASRRHRDSAKASRRPKQSVQRNRGTVIFAAESPFTLHSAPRRPRAVRGQMSILKSCVRQRGYRRSRCVPNVAGAGLWSTCPFVAWSPKTLTCLRDSCCGKFACPSRWLLTGLNHKQVGSTYCLASILPASSGLHHIRRITIRRGTPEATPRTTVAVFIPNSHLDLSHTIAANSRRDQHERRLIESFPRQVALARRIPDRTIRASTTT